MIIRNRTRFNTKALGKLAREVARRELWSKGYTENVIIYVFPRIKRRGCHGRAPYGGGHFSLYLHPEDRPRAIASTIAHEAAHNYGVKHRAMSAHLRYVNEGEHWAWADAYPVPLKAERVVVKLRQRPDSDKLAHAQRAARRAATKAKRAQTILRKWQAKVRYYEKRLAAATQPPAPEGGETA